MSYPETLKSIIQACAIENIKEVKPVYGGDINESYSLKANDRFFLKVNDSDRYPQMFEKEANGLDALRGVANCHVPLVVKHGVSGPKQFLLLKWMEKGSPQKKFWETFGNALAELHQRTQTHFGFHEDNYIGSLHQNNNPKTTWGEFYIENRILPLVKQLVDDHAVSASELKSVERLGSKLNDIFPGEKPALLHGDLWSGNFMVADDGHPAMYDPAVYYGHREMDLGMTKLFGGFNQEFYDSYHNAFPLERSWKVRIELTQLYPLLVHAILFGGGYIQQTVSIIKRFS